MKKVSFLLFAVLIGFLSACGPTAEEAAKYNDKIVAEQSEIVQKTDALIETYTTFINEDIQSAYDNAVSQVDASLKVVNEMEDFNKSGVFKGEAVELFNSYKSILEVEHKEMVRLYALPDTAFTQEHSLNWDKLSEDADAKTQAAIEKFKLAQEKFAKENNLELTVE